MAFKTRFKILGLGRSTLKKWHTINLNKKRSNFIFNKITKTNQTIIIYDLVTILRDSNNQQNHQKMYNIITKLTAKVLNPIGSVRSFSKSVAQDPTRPMSMPRSLAKLPVWEAVSGSFSSVMVTSSTPGFEFGCKNNKKKPFFKCHFFKINTTTYRKCLK